MLGTTCAQQLQDATLQPAGAANDLSGERMLASRQLRAMDGYGLEISSCQGGGRPSRDIA